MRIELIEHGEYAIEGLLIGLLGRRKSSAIDAARWAWRTKIETQFAVDLRLRIWTQAEDEAVKVFAANLRDLLLAAPAGGRSTIGLDPGFRTGVKGRRRDRQDRRDDGDLSARAAAQMGREHRRSPRSPPGTRPS